MTCVWLPYILQCRGTQKSRIIYRNNVRLKHLTPLDQNRTKLSCGESPKVHVKTKFAAHVVLKDLSTHVCFLTG